MLAFRIIATVLMSISVITGITKNASCFEEENTVIFSSLWSILWRAFVIVAIWVI